MKKPTKRKSVKKLPISHHVRASLLSVAPHASTGRRLPHHHTSHGALLLIMALAGAILTVLLMTIQTNALTLTGSGDVTITAQVNGDAPTVGAVITSPVDKTKTDTRQLTVSGTCPVGTLVALYNNGTSVGSVACSNNGTFTLDIDLIVGSNVLQAQDYDLQNQAGPTTPQVTVDYAPPAEPNNPVKAPTMTVDQTIITPPTPLPVANPCYKNPSEQTPLDGQLSLTVSCITKDIFVGQTLYLPIRIQGGVAPYALTIDWGDASDLDLRSFPQAGNYLIDHIFRTPKIKTLTLKVADAKGNTFGIQTIVQVNGSDTATSTKPAPLKPTVNPSWLEATIPIYAGLLVLIAGFWLGDIFQRIIRSKKPVHRRRHT